MQDPEADTREEEEAMSMPSPLSVEQVVEMEQAHEPEERAPYEEEAPIQKEDMLGVEQRINTGTPPREATSKETVEEAGSPSLP